MTMQWSTFTFGMSTLVFLTWFIFIVLCLCAIYRRPLSSHYTVNNAGASTRPLLRPDSHMYIQSSIEVFGCLFVFVVCCIYAIVYDYQTSVIATRTLIKGAAE
jgi:hypothetical protein